MAINLFKFLNNIIPVKGAQQAPTTAPTEGSTDAAPGTQAETPQQPQQTAQQAGVHQPGQQAPPQQEQPEEEYDLKAKEQEAEKKRRRFNLTIKTIVIGVTGFIAFLILFNTGLVIWNKNKPTYQQKEPPPDTTPIKDPNDPGDILYDDLALYKSDLFRLSLKYPERAKLTEKEIEGENPQKLVISHDDYVFKQYYDSEKDIKQITNELPEILESELDQGFIFKITLLSLPREIDEVAQIKRAAFTQDCPESAVVKDAFGLLIDEIDSASFYVDNCRGSHRITYVPRFGIYFEIHQIYTGDIGYRQKFAAMTDDILNSVDFYLSDEEIPIYEPYKTYIDPKHPVTFKYHSDLALNCCDVFDPVPNVKFTQLATFGVQLSVESEEYSKVAVFVTNYSNRPTFNDRKPEFESTYQEHKNLLVTDYKLVTGNTPDTKIEEIVVGGHKAYRLQGFSFRGYDIVYVSDNGNSTYVIVFDPQEGIDFEPYIQKVLETFEFTPY
jgi:hypothetical protein